MLQLFAIFLRTVPFSAILSNSSRPFSLRAFYHYGSGSLYFSLVIAAISDRLPKFTITSNSYGTKLTRSSIYLKKIGPNLIKKNLHLIIFLLTGIKYWKMIMKKIDYSTQSVLDKTNMLVDTYASMKSEIFNKTLDSHWFTKVNWLSAQLQEVLFYKEYSWFTAKRLLWKIFCNTQQLMIYLTQLAKYSLC